MCEDEILSFYERHERKRFGSSLLSIYILKRDELLDRFTIGAYHVVGRSVDESRFGSSSNRGRWRYPALDGDVVYCFFHSANDRKHVMLLAILRTTAHGSAAKLRVWAETGGV